MAIESDDEARHAAEAIIADVAAGNMATADEFVALYSGPSDALRIAKYLSPMLHDPFVHHEAGDTSPETERLAAFYRTLTDDLRALNAETAVADGNGPRSDAPPRWRRSHRLRTSPIG